MSWGDLVLTLLLNPDGQPGDPFGWILAFAAHFAVGFAGLCALMVLRWMLGRPVILALVLYALWEVWHWLIGGTLADSIIDWSAVALGVLAFHGAARSRPGTLFASTLGAALIATAGLARRIHKKE